jgi:hypothetical protein
MPPMSVRVRALVAVASLLAATSSCKPSTTQPPTGPAAPVAVEFENPGGMWMPTQMVGHTETLKTLGLGYDPAALGDPTSFPLGAVVSLGGCSASFVSPQGLVITNHHCVIGALQNNSTPDQNLLVDGFLAPTRADEKPAGAGQRIYVTQAIREVTGEMTQGLDQIADPQARFLETQKRTRDLEQTCEAQKPGHDCSVRSFFEGAEYYMIDALEIRDVRLVYAPHAGIGAFGGEVDNWRWPRHTGDFSFLRAYVGKDGQPADPSPDNVPYVPPHHLRIASEPLEGGDFVMVAGYPGRTNRLSTAEEVKDAISWRYPRDIGRYGETIALLEALGKQRPELLIKSASRLRRLANYHTNFQGMLDGLTKGGLAEQKAKLEADLQAWIAGDAARTAKYGGVFEKLAALDAEYRKFRDHDAALRELVEGSQLFGAALAAAVTAQNTAAGKPAQGDLAAMIDGAMKTYDAELDRALFRLAIERTTRLPAEQRPADALTALLGKPGADGNWDAAAIDAGLAKLYGKTKLVEPRFREKLIAAKDTAKLKQLRDPFVKAAVTLAPVFIAAQGREETRAGSMAALRPTFVAALREYSKTPVAPDANSTLRITYGTVRGYKPTPDAPVFEPFTTLSQMVAKNTGTEPFAAPAKLIAAANGDKGPYRVEALGDVPLDFLADLDITGGNSGSATLNAKGELVGLAFDGNYEAIASNWMFIPGITRSIHVDIRFVLWVLDAVDEGDRLLMEMGVTPKVAATHGAPGEAAKTPAPSAAPVEPAKAPTASAATQPVAPAVAG